MFLDPTPISAERTAADHLPDDERDLGPEGIALRMLAGFAVGLVLVQLIAWITGRPGVLAMFGWA